VLLVAHAAVPGVPSATYALGADVLVLLRLLDAVPVSLPALVVGSVVLGLGHLSSQQLQLERSTPAVHMNIRWLDLLQHVLAAAARLSAQRVRGISAASEAQEALASVRTHLLFTSSRQKGLRVHCR